jgi:amino acid adenylation domain-containing protein
VQDAVEAVWQAGAGSSYGRAPLELSIIANEPGDTIVLTAQHAFLDGQGFIIFVREVLAPVLKGDHQVPLSDDSPPNFDAYLDWLDQEAVNPSHESYWRRRMDNADVGIGIDFLAASDSPRTVSTGRCARFGATKRILNDPATRGVRSRLDELRVRPSTASHAVVGLLLASGAGAPDAVFGSVRAMRDVPVAGVGSLLGNLATSIGVRVQASHKRSIGELLQSIRCDDRTARNHACLPIHDLQRVLRGATGRPFEVLVVHNDGSWFEQVQRELGPIAKNVEFRQEPSNPLVFLISFGRTIELELKWDRSRVSDERAERLADRFAMLMAELAGDPSRLVQSLPVCTEAEIASVRAVGDGGPSVCAPMRLDDGFRRVLLQTPDAIAIRTLDAQMTYGEVHRRARVLAHALRELSAPSDAPVALVMGRDLLLPAAQLATWYAGTSFVMIDPELPSERVRMMLEDSRARIVIGRKEDCITLGELGLAHIDPSYDGPALHEGNFARDASDSVAYALFTSGSTGRPKLALLTHQGVANYLFGIHRCYSLPVRVSTVAMTPVGFDPSIIELHLALLTGGCIGLLPRGTHLDFEHMTRIVESVEASFATFVPSVLERFLVRLAEPKATRERARVHSLRAVVSGGEELSSRIPPLFHAIFGECAPGKFAQTKLFNAYGPTEASIGVTAMPIQLSDIHPYPIGRCVPGVRVRVIDDAGRTLPIGALGELVIAGIQVGRGYANDALRTAQRFRDDGDSDGACYLTGDLATIDECGIVRFYGRKDLQLKLRGVRIEPGEIERAMCEVSGVQSAVVWYHGEAGSRKLVGYYMADPAARSESSDTVERRILTHLKGVLPRQVVPSLLVRVAAWPLNANGKIDRTRLIPLSNPRNSEPTDSAPPPAMTLAERQIRVRVAELFAEVLKSRDIRMTSSFLDLGGDSLGAVVLLDKIAREFGIAPGIGDFLHEPTPVAIAQKLLERGATVRVERVVQIHPSVASETLHCLPGIGGLAAFTYLPIAGEVVDEFRCLGYQLPGASDREQPMLSFSRIAKLLAARVEEQTPIGDIHLVGYSFGGHLAVEIATMLAARGRTIATLVVLDAAPPRPIERVRMLLRHLAWSLGYRGATVRLTELEKLAGLRTVRGDDLGEVERRLRAVMRLSQVSVALHRPRMIPCRLDLVVSNGGDVGVPGFREYVTSAWTPYARYGLRIESSDTGHVMLVRSAGVPAIARVLRRSLEERAGRKRS